MQEISTELAKNILTRSARIYSNLSGKEGIKLLLDSMGSIQLDTLPIVGRNHDLIYQARMKGYRVDDFLDLVHEKRWGFEHFDKNLAMISMKFFPLTHAWMKLGGDHYYQRREKKLREKYPKAFDEILHLLMENESISSKEIETDSVSNTEYNGWKAGKVGAGVLDCLWNRGKAFIHHRESYRRYYSLPEKRIAQKYLDANGPDTIEEFCKSLLTRRVNQIGLASKPWQPKCSRPYVKELIRSGQLREVKISGGKQIYLTTSDILEETESIDDAYDDRTRFMGPLDPLIWERKMTLEAFNFDYVWEVYKPPKDRIWGYYLIPVFYQNEFLGRIDLKYDRERKILQLKKGYWERKIKPTQELREKIAEELRKFCDYLEAEAINFTATDNQWKKVCKESGMSNQ